MTTRLLVSAVVGAFLALVVLVGPASAAPNGGGCQLHGTASFSPGLTNTAQNFSYSFTGSLTNCQSSSGGPATGTVIAGTNGLPTPTGNGSCGSSTTGGVAVAQWADGTTTVVQYSTSGAAAVACRAMDLELSDEQRLIQETAREFTDKEIVPRARENDRNHHFDLELIAQMAEQGYLGAIVPREYGGAGLDYLTYGLIVEEVGRGCSAMRTVVSVQTSLVCSAILRWGTEEQKQRYLPKLCSGEWLGCFGLTEPDTGSDAANQKTRAKRSDGGWVINGSKMFISLGNHAKVALVFAQTDPEKGHRGVACFLVDTDQPGFQAQEIHHKLGLRGSDTAEISLDDVEAPQQSMLGAV